MSAASDAVSGRKPALGARSATHDSPRRQPMSARATTERVKMLHYAVIFFVIALIAAVFGFSGIAAGAAGIAKILFFVFLILAVVSFIANTARR
jgi:uncharacterized membrane protein YtjA (UPF0391 family)